MFMRKVLIIHLLLPFFTHAQITIAKMPEGKPPEEPVVTETLQQIIIKYSFMAPKLWESWYKTHNYYFKSISSGDALLNIDDTIRKNNNSIYSFYRKYAEKFIGDVKNIDGHPTNFLSHIMHYSVAKSSKDENILLFPTFAIESTFNTLRLTEKQRASSAITSYALPILKKINNYIIPGISKIGIALTYGSNNLLSDNLADLKAEWICLISPLPIIEKFNNNEISSDELIGASDIYLKSRNDEKANKILITLE